MENKNNRKNPFSIVWYNKRLASILTNKLANPYILVTPCDKVKKSSVKLLKIGDVVKIDEDRINELPERWRTKNNMRVTKILSNGIIETDYSTLENDGINYSFLVGI